MDWYESALDFVKIWHGARKYLTWIILIMHMYSKEWNRIKTLTEIYMIQVLMSRITDTVECLSNNVTSHWEWILGSSSATGRTFSVQFFRSIFLRIDFVLVENKKPGTILFILSADQNIKHVQIIKALKVIKANKLKG